MVGRERIFDNAEIFLDKIFEGTSPGALRFWAEAGTGKTRLVNELRYSKQELDFLIITAENTSMTTPFQDYLSHWADVDTFATAESNREVFNDIFEEFLVSVSLTKNKRACELTTELQRTSSILMSMSGIEPEADTLFWKLQPAERFKNRSDAVVAYLRARSLMQPLVVVLENIQWFSPSSLNLIKNTLTECTEYPIAFIMTARPALDGAAPEFPESKGLSKGNTVFLEGLPYASIGEFIENLTGSNPDSDLVDFIWDRAGGLPLFIEQIVGYLDESNLLQQRDGRLSLIDNSETITGSMSDVFLARIRLLPEQVARMLGAAGVFGMEFTSVLLSEVLQENIYESIETALGKGIFIVHDGEIAFAHELFRDSAVLLNTEELNEQQHYRAGEILERNVSGLNCTPSMYESIGNHFQISGNIDRAAPNIAKAAEGYADLFENAKAALLYRRLTSITKGARRIEYELELAEVLKRSGLYIDAVNLLKEILKTVSADRNIDDSLEDKVKLQYGSHLGFLGKTDEAEVLLLESLAEFENSSDTLQSAIALRRILMIKMTSGKMQGCSELAIRAMEYAAQTHISAEICSTLYWVVGYYRRSGQYDEMKKFAKELVREAESTGNLKSLITGYSSMMSYHIYNLDYDKASEVYDKLKKVADETGNLSALSTAANKMGIVHTRLEELDEAMLCFREVLVYAKKTGSIRSMCGALGNIIGILLNQEKYDEAQRYTQQLIDRSSEIGFKLGILSGYARMVPIFIRKGAYEAALDCAETHLEIALSSSDARNTSDAYYNIAKISLYLNRLGEARINMKKALDKSTEIKEKRLEGAQNLLNCRILIELRELEGASEAAEKASEYFGKMETKAHEQLLSLVYTTFLEAAAGNETACDKLLELLQGIDDENSRAEIYYYHYLATGSADSADKARSVLEKLYSETRMPLINKRLSEL